MKILPLFPQENADEDNALVYELKVSLVRSKPPIWRRLLVTGDTTLDELHLFVQICMGWENCHLHAFTISKTRYEPNPQPDDFFEDWDVRSTRETRLDEVIKRKGARFQYEYDFGDNWQHDIRVETIRPPMKGDQLPSCTGGRRACPPEDCGGIWGYADILQALDHPNDPEWEERLEWLGEGFDPAHFDREKINAYLKKNEWRTEWVKSTEAGYFGESLTADELRDELRCSSESQPEMLLRTVCENHDQVGCFLAECIGRDQELPVAQGAFAAMHFGIHHPHRLEEPEELLQEFCDSALPLLRNSKVKDERKCMLVATLMQAGVEMDPEELRACFKDFDSAMAAIQEQATEDLNEQPMSQVLFLYESHADGFDQTLDLAAQLESGLGACIALSEQGNPAAAPLWCAFALAAGSEQIESVRLSFSHMQWDRIPGAAWYLQVFRHMPGSQAFHLLTESIAPTLSGAPELLPIHCTFEEGRLSQLDAVGSRSLVLRYRTTDGRCDTLHFLFNDSCGVMDAFGIFGDGDESWTAALQASASDDVYLAPCSLKLAREVIAHAWADQKERNLHLPPLWILLLPYLGLEPLEPQRREPDCSAFDSILSNPDEVVVVQQSEALADPNAPVFGQYSIHSDEAFDFVKTHLPKRNRKLTTKAFIEFLNDVLPGELPRLKQWLASNLEIMALAGEPESPAAGLAAQVLGALRQGRIEPEEIGYVRQIAEDSGVELIRDVRDGFGSYDEIRQAQKEAGDEFSGDMGELMGDFFSTWMLDEDE